MFPVALPIASLAILLTQAHGDEMRQARAHTHGEGEALISLEGGEFFFQVTAPAANFVTSQGEGISLAAGSALEFRSGLFPVEPDQIIKLPKSAKCEVSGLTLESEAINGSADDHHEHHDGDHEGHDDHDHDHDHDDHDHDEHGDHDEHAGHSNILLTVEAACQKPEKIKSVELTLFQTWAGFENLSTTFLTDDGANAARLTPDSRKIDRP